MYFSISCESLDACCRCLLCCHYPGSGIDCSGCDGCDCNDIGNAFECCFQVLCCPILILGEC